MNIIMKIKHTPLLLLVLLLTACHSAWITNLAVASGQVLYKDDFSDPTSGWPRLAGSNGMTDYVDGSYRILVLVPGYNLWAQPGQYFGEVQVEADATVLNGPAINRVGLVCRYQDQQDYSFFIISSDGYYAIGKTVKGVTSLLGQDSMAHTSVILPGAGPNHLRFDCTSTTLAGYVNGQALALINDADSSGGDVGLIAGTFLTPGVDVSFDDFMVTKP